MGHPLVCATRCLINYLFAAQHEFNHYTVFETRWLNDVFNRVTGFLLLYPRSQERWFHYQHHRHTQDWDNDAELLAREGPYRLAPYLIYLLGISYWWNRVRRMFRDASGNVVGNYYTAPQRAHIIAEARWHLGLYSIGILASMLLESAAMVTLWLAPMLVTKVFHQIQNITSTLASHTRTIRVSTRVPFAQRDSCDGLPGTCSTTPPTTPTRPCRSPVAEAARGDGGGIGFRTTNGRVLSFRFGSFVRSCVALNPMRASMRSRRCQTNSERTPRQKTKRDTLMANGLRVAIITGSGSGIGRAALWLWLMMVGA